MLPAPTNHFPATPIIPALTRNSGVGLSPACATFRATSFANFCQRITIQVLTQTISARRPNPAPNFPEFPPPASPATPAPCQNESRKANLQVYLLICYTEFAVPRKNLASPSSTSSSRGPVGAPRARRRRFPRPLAHRICRPGAARQGGPATTAELARAESMKPQSMGATVAALEEMGMVERKPHPTDGRQMNIELSAKGAAVRNSARDAKRTWLAQAIAQLDDANGKPCSRPARSSSAWWKSEAAAEHRSEPEPTALRVRSPMPGAPCAIAISSCSSPARASR